jgi:hypothetical protein
MQGRWMAALAVAALLAAGCGDGKGGGSKHGGKDGHHGDGESRAEAADTASPSDADSLAYDEEDAGDRRHRWQVKTSLAPDADPARATAVPLADLIALPEVPGVTEGDKRYQTERIAGPVGRSGLREGQMVTTRGWLHLVAHPADDDYHLQLTASQASGDGALIVEIPDPQKVGDARLRPLADAARRWVRDRALGGQKPKKKGTELAPPIFVTVTGALFYDDAHVGEPARGKLDQRAATLWEIHPVTAIDAATP